MTESCSQCGENTCNLPALSSGERPPCPNCGSTARTYHVAIREEAHAHDHISVLGESKGQHQFFDESTRVDGRAATARRDAEGTLSLSATGTSPQGEEQTLSVCRLLIRRLNALGNTWHEPTPSTESNIDCQSTEMRNGESILHIQVVRADAEPHVWKELNARGVTGQAGVSVVDLADRLERAIRKKAERMTASDRATLTLALDATLLPALGFDVVTDEFRRRHGLWARALGFQAIWLVGPTDALIARLDLLPQVPCA